MYETRQARYQSEAISTRQLTGLRGEIDLRREDSGPREVTQESHTFALLPTEAVPTLSRLMLHCPAPQMFFFSFFLLFFL